MTVQVLLVEDHGLLAQTLVAALRGHDVQVDSVHVDTVQQVRDAVDELDPEVVLLDLDLGPAGSGGDLVAELTDRGARVVMITGVTDPVRLAECVEAGAVGILSKTMSFDELLARVRTVLDGRPLLTAEGRERYLDVLRAHRTRRREDLRDFEELTPKESEVLGALTRGRQVSEIADDQVIAESTVRSHVRSILTKLRVHSQVAALGRVRESGWEPPPG